MNLKVQSCLGSFCSCVILVRARSYSVAEWVRPSSVNDFTANRNSLALLSVLKISGGLPTPLRRSRAPAFIPTISL